MVEIPIFQQLMECGSKCCICTINCFFNNLLYFSELKSLNCILFCVLFRSPEPRLVAKALYNFVGQTARELTFRKGELIYVRRQIDKNWYEGELNAMVGLFPVNYVEVRKSFQNKKANLSNKK